MNWSDELEAWAMRLAKRSPATEAEQPPGKSLFFANPE